MKSILITIISLLVCSTSYAQLFDANGLFLNGVNDPNDSRVGWELLNYNQKQSGVVSLAFMKKKESLFCSGALITKSPVEDSNPVYLLTNGHCTTLVDEFMKNPELLVKDKNIQPIYMVFNNFFDSQKKLNFVEINKIAYARINKKDFALFDTQKSVKFFSDENIQTYTFANKISHEVISVGTPLQGFHPNQWYLYQSYCRFDKKVNLVEGLFKYLSVRNNCSLVGGQSGSPMFNEYYEILAIQNTGYDEKSDDSDCQIGKPCEVQTGHRYIAEKSWSYAQDTIGLNDCFNKNGVFNATNTECPLKNL